VIAVIIQTLSSQRQFCRTNGFPSHFQTRVAVIAQSEGTTFHPNLGEKAFRNKMPKTGTPICR
jgi:hypothetical protein